MVELLVAAGATVDSNDTSQPTPLHVVAWSGHVATAEKLLKCGTSTGIISIAKALIESGADIDTKDMYGIPLVHFAASNGLEALAELLLKVVLPSNQNQELPNGFTPLHIAILNNRPSSVEALLKAGASNWGTPLHLAETNEMASLLYNGSAIDAKNKDGITPLCSAVFRDHAEKVQLLLKCRANPNQKTKEVGKTLLHHAAYSRSEKVVEQLLLASASVDAKDKRGWTPLHHAASSGSSEVVKLLLKYGAPINEEDKNGLPPLHYAKDYDHTGVIKLLQQAGASSEYMSIQCCVDK
ncbi:ankyrin repeat protein [Thraustotheca clavata]|uniref:Ankyrin repeat protein n=1 Tax=Thraustotheca clavata TaxID=74557 RepID=A0A1W0A5K8_9STRA|nr:ankyrin repeat protein [Thraustotheca clavata]